MCTNNTEKIPSRLDHSLERKQRSKRSRVQVQGDNSRCEEKVEKDIVLKNLKLYLENKSIIEENEKLRRKACLLHQENLALMSEFQKKFPDWDHSSSTISLLHKH
ncbi:protein LITTLE ZIPPER 1-like isoform X2 [Fagus crenata]